MDILHHFFVFSGATAMRLLPIKNEELWEEGELLPKYMQRHVCLNHRITLEEIHEQPYDLKSKVFWLGSGNNVQSLLITDNPWLVKRVIHTDARRWAYREIEGGMRIWMAEQFGGKEPPNIHPADYAYFQECLDKRQTIH
jgi:hypothetical protein